MKNNMTINTNKRQRKTTLRKTLACLLTAASLLLPTGMRAAEGDITTKDELQDISGNGTYTIKNDIDATGLTSIASFSGTLQADINPATKMPYRIKNLSAPLFTTLTGTVKNLVIENCTISTGDASGNTGAIACTANGEARIYNVGILGGEVSSTNYVGGLVGLLDGTARVVNCYSFANITGGSVKAGIVGYNNYASKYNDLHTMVMNCMFYGNIATGSSIYPIYGGKEISNDYNANAVNRLNNYNYFLYEADFSTGSRITAYNCALAAERRFLVRFEFYRHLLNSTRELAAWYATGSATQSTMLKWVLDKSVAPYPVLKEQGRYPSVVNYDPDNTYDLTTNAKISRSGVTTRNQGGTIKVEGVDQTLKIYVSNSKTDGGQTWPAGASITNTYRPGNSGLTVKRTDKDTANFNFNYDKVQLPYYNDVGTNNYTSNKVVTGWKIISMEGGTAGGYTEANYDAPNYNFADRSHYGKDIYNTSVAGNSGRIYAQGAYFNVPTGVTSITIEPYWGKCAYLSDANYDRYGYNNTDDLSQIGGGRYTNGSDCPVLSGTQKVYTTFSNALDALSGVNNPTVYDYAVVLVGNYHHHATEGKNGPELSEGNKPFTIMSIDLNEDNEPDYCLIYRSGKNRQISPIRFDFITVPGMVMAHKMSSNGDLGIPGNCCPKGWFEITTTGLIKYGQFEHSQSGKTLAPIIFMGGIIDQIVANNTDQNASAPTKTKYMLFGDNVWFKMFNNGCHMDKWFSPPRRPVSITGGEYEKLYLSGFFRPDASVPQENAECYIDGGAFGEVAGAGQEQIDGNVSWFINHADIKKFYGGGINAAKPITGNITTNIDNSHVDYFCGGPQFGNMQKEGSITLTWATNQVGTSTASTTKTIDADRSVTTNANNCTFGTFFGAGYGGTAIYREQFYNKFESLNYNAWNSNVNSNYKSGTRGYYVQGKGVKVNYEYEFFGGSAGNVHRLYLWYASFSLAQTNDVVSTLTGCTVTGNFYGGGSLGAVSGNTTSTLTDCTVKGNVFGAGFSVEIPTVDVRNLRTNPGPFVPEPKYNTNTGVYEPGGFPANVEYKWVQSTVANNSNALVDDGDDHTIKTNEPLNALGSVQGNVSLSILGNSHIGNGAHDATHGNIFGGGDQSAVNGNTTVIIGDNTEVEGNVYGGGNEGAVGGTTTVNITNE